MKLKAELEEQKEIARQNAENAKKPENELMQQQITLYKGMIMCSACNKREKQKVLMKCMHVFCEQCINENIRMRQRACPHCRTKFD